jgi:hypothetical protein
MVLGVQANLTYISNNSDEVHLLTEFDGAWNLPDVDNPPPVPTISMHGEAGTKSGGGGEIGAPITLKIMSPRTDWHSPRFRKRYDAKRVHIQVEAEYDARGRPQDVDTLALASFTYQGQEHKLIKVLGPTGPPNSGAVAASDAKAGDTIQVRLLNEVDASFQAGDGLNIYVSLNITMTPVPIAKGPPPRKHH